MKRYIIIPFLIILSVFIFLACFSTKKIQTKVITETVIKFDTVIQVQKDTVTLVKYVRLTDTAFIENPTVKARSYYSTKKQRIVLELTGKKFDVPVSIYKHVTMTTDKAEKEKIPVNKPVRWQYVIMFILLLLFLYAYLTRKR